MFVFIGITFTSCPLIDPDPCDKTVKPEIEAGIKVIIHVPDRNKNPTPNQQFSVKPETPATLSRCRQKFSVKPETPATCKQD